MTVNECIEIYTEQCIATGKRSRAWKAFCKQFAERWGEMDIAEALRPRSVRAWIGDEKAKGVKDSSIVIKASTLRQLCVIAREEGVSVEFPQSVCRSLVVDNARRRWLRESEEKALKEDMHPEDFEIVRFFYLNGLRSQEGWLLKVADVDTDNMRMVLRRTKHNKEQVAELHPASKALVLRARRKGLEYVLNSPGIAIANRIQYGEYWKQTRFKPALERCNIKDFRTHDLRHTTATRMANKGVNVVSINALMRHSRIDMTMRYVHPHRKTIREGFAALS